MTIAAHDFRKQWWRGQRRPQKYGAKPERTEDGYFASQRELQHWHISKLREKAGEIRNLERQVRFRLEINGVHICDYIADEAHFEGERRVVIDVKGVETDVFKLKRKLMKALHNIDVVTV
jgi:hypothetical protein